MRVPLLPDGDRRERKLVNCGLLVLASLDKETAGAVLCSIDLDAEGTVSHKNDPVINIDRVRSAGRSSRSRSSRSLHAPTFVWNIFRRGSKIGPDNRL